MVQTLAMLMEQEVIERGSPETLALLIFAAMNEAALSIAHAADPGRYRLIRIHYW